MSQEDTVIGPDKNSGKYLEIGGRFITINGEENDKAVSMFFVKRVSGIEGLTQRQEPKFEFHLIFYHCFSSDRN